MMVLTCRITLTQPVLTGQVGGGDPNSSLSHDFLPGSALRGACIAAFLSQAGKHDLAKTTNGVRLFLSGGESFS